MRNTKTIGAALKDAKRVYMFLTPAAWPMPISFRVPKVVVRRAVDDLRAYNNEELASWLYDEETKTLSIHWAT